MGWNPAKLDTFDLTARELGLALGNAWAGNPDQIISAGKRDAVAVP